MRAHVPIGFSLPYYSLEGNIVSQELTIKKSIKGTKEKVGDVSSLRVEIYSLQNKVKTVEVDPCLKRLKFPYQICQMETIYLIWWKLAGLYLQIES